MDTTGNPKKVITEIATVALIALLHAAPADAQTPVPSGSVRLADQTADVTRLAAAAFGLHFPQIPARTLGTGGFATDDCAPTGIGIWVNHEPLPSCDDAAP